MPKKKSRSRYPHQTYGHYCKICGEYKANEKFSGRGHANHICRVCSKLSAADKAEAQTLTRLRNFHKDRLNANDKKWLENRAHDRRPEVAELAREVYNIYFPYAERNARKKQLLINTLVFELHVTTIFDEYGDEYPVNRRFTADRLTCELTMTDFDAGDMEQSIMLEKKQMTKLMRWVIHTLEIFMWEEDYRLAPEESEPEPKVCWRVKIEYADETTQEILSYEDYLYDRPDELFCTLWEYFKPEEVDIDEGF